MFKVGIIGPESSGKSTLCEYLAKRYDGFLVPEYARTYVEQKGTTEVTFDELCHIARHQIEELKRTANSQQPIANSQQPTANSQQPTANSQQPTANSQQPTANSQQPIAFFDTELVVTKVWFDYAFGRVPEWLNENIRRYPMDVYLLTYPDLPWVPDPARSNGSDAIRMELFNRYEAEIQALDIPYYIIKHQI